MDLRNDQITIGELLADPEARKVLTKRFPHVIGRPIVSAASTLTLEQTLKLVSAYVPRKVLQETLEDLRRL